MAFTKVWNSDNSGDYSAAANWKPVSVRNAAYRWQPSGTNSEYYLQTIDGANPGFQAEPGLVLINGVSAVEGTLGSLANGTWAYGDGNTLGYDTIYVKLAGGDPDGMALDYVSFQQIPKSSEHVRLAPGTAAITSGLDQSAVALASFIGEEGYTALVASDFQYLRIQTSRFEWSGTGVAYIDLTTSTVAPQVMATAAPQDGERGLYLLGSALGIVNVIDGQVGIAVNGGETATVMTLRILSQSASVWIGAGCALTNWMQYNGEGKLRTSGTVASVVVYSGTLTTSETVALTAVTQHGGTVTPNSTGTIAAYHIHGGTLDLRLSGAAREITALHKYYGSYSIRRNKEAVTITAETYEDTVDESITQAT